MNIALLSDIEFGNEEAFREMLDYNALVHDTIYRALLEAGTLIPHYPLFTFGGDDADWRFVHAAEHRSIAAALNISGAGADLEAVDFEDENQYDAWLTQHAAHHGAIAGALGL